MGGVITLGDSSMGAVEAAEQFGYNGPDPKAGSYRFKTSETWLLGATAKGDKRITVPIVIDEPKGTEKAKYNGFTVFHGMNVTDQGTPFNNAFLESLGIDPKKFWVAKAKTEDGSKPGTLKITKMQGIELGGRLIVGRIVEKDGYWNLRSHGPYVAPDDFSADESTEDDDDFGSNVAQGAEVDEEEDDF